MGDQYLGLFLGNVVTYSGSTLPWKDNCPALLCPCIGYSLLYLIETTHTPDLTGMATELEAVRI